MTNLANSDHELLSAIRAVLNQAQRQLQSTINHTMVQTYWNVGRLIITHEQQGQDRANYGQKQLQNLSKQLKKEFGKGFEERNLRNMRAFYQAFPKWNAVRSELSWTHYRILLRVENLNAREWYTTECIEQNWSSRALERQITTLYYERLLSSKDKKPVIQEMLKNTQNLQTNVQNYLRDPYILDFLNLPYAPILESTIEQGLMNNLQQFLLELGKGVRHEVVHKSCFH